MNIAKFIMRTNLLKIIQRILFIGIGLLIIISILSTTPPALIKHELIHSIKNSQTVDFKLDSGHAHHLILAMPNSEEEGHLEGAVKITNDKGHIFFEKKFDTDMLEKTDISHNKDILQAWIITSDLVAESSRLLDDTVLYQLQIDITATNQSTIVSLWHKYLKPFGISRICWFIVKQIGLSSFLRYMSFLWWWLYMLL